jgi:hypothetical protein
MDTIIKNRDLIITEKEERRRRMGEIKITKHKIQKPNNQQYQSTNFNPLLVVIFSL